MPELAWDIGYRDQACWVMYERRPGGSILVLDTGEVEETMSDFKVGDVVRCSVKDCNCLKEDEVVLAVQGFVLKTASGWVHDRYVSLVSRPSEPAKPTPNAGVWGVCLGCQGDIGNSYGWCKACADNGFKDARPTQQPYPPGTKVYVTGNPEGEGFITESFTNTYLSDERIYAVMIPYAPYPIHYPASAVTVVGDAPPKPMTATEASIRAQNVKAWTLPPAMVEWQQKLLREIDGFAMTHEEAVIRGVKVEDNKLVKSDSWMPAGTYMPLGEGKLETGKIQMPKHVLPYQSNGSRVLGRLGAPSDGAISTLATKTLPKPRFPERTRLTTRSWDPGYGDLEDA